MFTSPRLLTALAAACAIVALPATAAHAKTKKITCDLDLFATIPQPAPTAANYGSAKCSSPFGFGVQKDSSTVTRTSALTGDFTGPFKLFFNEGTIKGTFKIAFATTVDATPKIIGVKYTGTLQVTGGTGKYSGVRGSGKLTGTSPDATRTSLSETLTLRGLR